MFQRRECTFVCVCLQLFIAVCVRVCMCACVGVCLLIVHHMCDSMENLGRGSMDPVEHSCVHVLCHVYTYTAC